MIPPSVRGIHPGVMAYVHAQGYRVLEVGESPAKGDLFRWPRDRLAMQSDSRSWDLSNLSTESTDHWCQYAGVGGLPIREDSAFVVRPTGKGKSPQISAIDTVRGRLAQLADKVDNSAMVSAYWTDNEAPPNKEECIVQLHDEFDGDLHNFRMVADALRQVICDAEAAVQEKIEQRFGELPLAVLAQRVDVLPRPCNVVHDDLWPLVIRCQYTGSRVICREPRPGADLDLLVLTPDLAKFSEVAYASGYECLGSGYGSDPPTAKSLVFEWVDAEHGTIHLIVTSDPDYYERWSLATEVAVSLKLERKKDRITLFQAMVNGRTPPEE